MARKQKVVGKLQLLLRRVKFQLMKMSLANPVPLVKRVRKVPQVIKAQLAQLEASVVFELKALISYQEVFLDAPALEQARQFSLMYGFQLSFLQLLFIQRQRDFMGVL